MSSSQEKVLQMRRIRMDQAEYRASCPDVLSNEQFEEMKKSFYQYADDNGWYENLEQSIKMGGKFIWDWQNELIDEILRSVFQKKGFNIFLSAKRQEGKTEIVALVLVFCYENYFLTFGETFGVGIVGPGRTMSSTVFRRLENYLLTQASDLYVDRSDYKESLRGDSLAALSISETGGTTVEGRTLNFVLRDEAHAGSDRRWRDEVLWTTAAKEGATIMMLGCAGYKKCDFMAALKAGTDKDNKVHVIDYNRLKPYMAGLAKKGLRMAQTWEKRTEQLIRLNGGHNSPETRKNVYCEWQTDMGNYLSEKQIAACTKKIREFNPQIDQEPLIAFIDMGYSGDETVCSVWNMDSQVVGMKILKKANETRALRDQLESFFEWSDDMEFTPSYQTIGIDATGLGRGAAEMLTEMAPCGVFEITFSLQKKHEMFTTFRNHVVTDWHEDRITFPEDHPLMPRVIEELTDLEQTPAENGLLKFHAPTHSGVKKYDDIADALAGGFHTLLEFRKEFNTLTPYKKRHDRKAIFARKQKQALARKGLADVVNPRKRKNTTLLGSTVGIW